MAAVWSARAAHGVCATDQEAVCVRGGAPDLGVPGRPSTLMSRRGGRPFRVLIRTTFVEEKSVAARKATERPLDAALFPCFVVLCGSAVNWDFPDDYGFPCMVGPNLVSISAYCRTMICGEQMRLPRAFSSAAQLLLG